MVEFVRASTEDYYAITVNSEEIQSNTDSRRYLIEVANIGDNTDVLGHLFIYGDGGTEDEDHNKDCTNGSYRSIRTD